MRWILTITLNGIALLLVASLLDGVEVKGFVTALLAALILGIVNLFIRPLLLFFTLPITILTLGLFVFVINALTFWLTAGILKGFTVTGFGSAFLGALLMSFFSWLFQVLVVRRFE